MADTKLNETPSEQRTAGSLKQVVEPPELQAIIAEVRAQDAALDKWERDEGLPPPETTPEWREWWVKERAWTRWAKRQTGERLATLVMGVAAFYYEQTENHALLVEAAQRLKTTRAKRLNEKLCREAGQGDSK